MVHRLLLSNNPKGNQLVEKQPKHLLMGSNIHHVVMAALTPELGSSFPAARLPAGTRTKVRHQRSWCQTCVKHSYLPF